MIQDNTTECNDDEWTALPADFSVTEFPNQAPTTLTESRVTLAGLAERIKSARAPNKAELPWLKLARFNGEANPATDSGCVRYNAAVVTISGIEIDYDGEECRCPTRPTSCAGLG
jgi:hypothetical protein